MGKTGEEMDIIWNGIVEIINWIWDNLLVVNILLSIIMVFFQRRDPQTLWTWLLVLYFLPIVGFVLYLFIGQDMHKSKMFRVKEVEDALNQSIRGNEKELISEQFMPTSRGLTEYRDMVYYNLNIAGAVYTADNEVEVYTDGYEKFDALLCALRKAEKYIHIQYYIFRDDDLFWRIIEVLKEKAAEGVEVRILYDVLGSLEIKKRHWREIQAAGIKTAEFFPAALKKAHLRLNYRNHRKIVVIDGTTGFVGGFNVGNEYLGLSSKFGYWRDTHFKVQGSAAIGLQVRFALDWNHASGENLFLKASYFIQEAFVKSNRHKVGIQIIASGPDSKWPVIRNNYIKMIHKAKDHIYIQTPYFIPDEALAEALKVAASSGVTVRIMIPCKPDHPFVYWATYSYIGDMLDAGVECYTYMNGFLHAKGICVDGVVSSYGTANFDIRSFKLNFEVNAVIYDEVFTEKLERIFLEDMRQCHKVTREVYQNRSLVIRMKEQFSRLLSPLL